MTVDKKISATGKWVFVVGPEFEVLDNGDSVQASHGGRIVYVSSLQVGRTDLLAKAAELRVAVSKRFGSGERFSYVGDSVEGDAEVICEGDTWRLRGIMCADGTVATCVIDLPTLDEKSWAITVWKSLTCEAGLV